MKNGIVRGSWGRKGVGEKLSAAYFENKKNGVYLTLRPQTFSPSLK